MASMVRDPGGRIRICFTAPNGSRPSVRLGEVSEEIGELYRDNIGKLIVCHGHPELLPDKVLIWAKELPSKAYDKLAAAGLLPSRAPVVEKTPATVGELKTELEAELKHAKYNTRRNYVRVLELLVERFGAGKALVGIAPRDADAFVAWMREKGHGAATVARRIKHCRFIFNRAKRWQMTDNNPFDGIRAGASVNHARKAFVPLEDVETILGATSDHEFRCILALSRYGALRCPSEITPLRWADVRWDEGKLIVHSVKTESTRIVPLFPRLAEILLAAYEVAPEGAEYVVSTRDDTVNWRKKLQTLITRLGVKPWPKLFHNLRASRESELCREFPLATVCEWLGHRPEVAAVHYLTDPDHDDSFQRAIGKKVAQKAAYQGRELEEFEGASHRENPQETAENAVLAGVGGDTQCTRQESNLQPSG